MATEINVNMNRNELFVAICESLGVPVKFENGANGQKRPSVAVGGVASGYAHLLCNPRNCGIVIAAISAFGIDGTSYKPDSRFPGDEFRTFLYAVSQTASCRDVRYGAGKHVSKDAIKDNSQDVGYILHCQTIAKRLLGTSTGSTKLLASGKLLPHHAVKAGEFLTGRERINEASKKALAAIDRLLANKAPKTKPAAPAANVK